MSFAMDDLGMSYKIGTSIKTKLSEETRMVEKTTTDETSDSIKPEPEDTDAYEISKQKADSLTDSLINIQEKITAIDIAKEGLNKIKDQVNDIKTSIESEDTENTSQNSIEESYKKIEEIAKESSLSNEQIIKASDEKAENNISLEEMNIPEIKTLKTDSEDEKEASVNKLKDIINNIQNKSDTLSENQDSLSKGISTVVEIKIVPTEEEEVKIYEEHLKSSAINSIKENPEHSKNIQIRHLDRNLLLAMISLRMA